MKDKVGLQFRTLYNKDLHGLQRPIGLTALLNVLNITLED
jgi:hypothetical protein